jgi:hypothetical protein
VSGWTILASGVPALILVGLVLALVWRGKAPVWLPLAGFLALVVVNIGVAVIFDFHVAGVAILLSALFQVWCLIGCVLLLVATIAVARQWTSQAPILIVGFAMMAPLMALFFAVAVSG